MTKGNRPESKAYLLDTTALLAHYRNETGCEKVHAIVEDDSAEILVCAISIAEFARRILSLGADRDEAKKTAMEYAELADKVIAVDAAVSIRAFELGTVSTQRLPLIDALIAASAVSYGAVLVHRDSHFSGIAEQLMEQRFIGG